MKSKVTLKSVNFRGRSLGFVFTALAVAVFFSLAPIKFVQAQNPTAQKTIALSDHAQNAGGGNDAVRPFKVNIPQTAVADLRRRLAATRWPDKETVADDSQGAQLAQLQELVRYWGTDYDWRKGEAKLNALPQFVTEIDGVSIH